MFLCTMVFVSLGSGGAFAPRPGPFRQQAVASSQILGISTVGVKGLWRAVSFRFSASCVSGFMLDAGCRVCLGSSGRGREPGRHIPPVGRPERGRAMSRGNDQCSLAELSCGV